MKKKCSFVLLGVVSFLVAFMAGMVQAAVIDVYPTDSIQSAINASVNGDEVLVHEGYYSEHIVFPAGKVITVRAVGDVCLVGSYGPDSLVLFQTGANSTLDGFSLVANWLSGRSPARNNPSDPGTAYVTRAGSGIYVYHASPTIKNCKIGKVKDGYGSLIATLGAGVFCEYSTLTMIDCLLTGKYVPGQENNLLLSSLGGGIYSYNSTLDLQGCTISYAGSCHGGGIYYDVDNGDAGLYAELKNCSIVDCDACNCLASAIYFHSNNSGTLLTIYESEILRNYGGITTIEVRGGSLQVIKSRIEDNYYHPSIHYPMSTSQTTVYLDGTGSLDITNSIIAGNNHNDPVMPPMTAVSAHGSSLSITNSTIADNDIAISTNSGNNVVNSIIWGNNAVKSSYTGNLNITYSDVQGGWPGTGNINLDPLFSTAGDYSLQDASPCIDSGTDIAVNLPVDDLWGSIRPQDGDYSGTAEYDMGAYERADTDSDGIADIADNCIEKANGPLISDAGGNIQLDVDGDGYGNVCDGDLDQSGLINIFDWSLYRAVEGQSGVFAEDFNGDGVVDTGDRSLFITMYGLPPGPSYIDFQ